MRAFQLWAVALGATTMLSSAAGAADLTSAPESGWTGPYAGLSAGGAWSDAVVLSNEETRFTGGALLGYNWQHDMLVLGVEADMNYTDFGMDYSWASSFDLPFGFDVSSSESYEFGAGWYGTLRGRAGFAVNDFLFYGTGGYAFGRLNIDWDLDVFDGGTPANSFNFSQNDMNWGWTAGAGVEYAIDRWSVGIEYLYVDLGQVDWQTRYAFDLSTDTIDVSAEGTSYGVIDYQFSVVRSTFKLRF